MGLFRGWELIYKDGTKIREGQMDWKKAPKINVVKLVLHYDNRKWEIYDKLAYVQKKRASVVPGVADSFRVESRSIGYYEGNKKVWYTVDESTGQMKMEVKEIDA